MIAGSTLSIGLLPGYFYLGIYAPILLTVFRIVQGISVGGEIPGSTIFTAEHFFDKNCRGLAIGIIWMFITFGNVLGSVSGAILTNTIDHKHMILWGWRIPFIIGFFAGIVSYFLRKKLYETPVYQNLQKSRLYKSVKLPLFHLIRNRPLLLLSGFLLTALPAVTVSFILFLPTYLGEIISSGSNGFGNYSEVTISFFLFAVFSAFFGFISDIFGRKIIMVSGCIISSIVGGVIFYFISAPSQLMIILLVVLIPLSASLINGVYAVSLVELFPAYCRNSGFGLSFNAGLAIIGGTTPFLFTYSIKVTGLVAAPYFILFFCSVLSLIGALTWKSRFQEMLNFRST